jgi:hypothetical protein
MSPTELKVEALRLANQAVATSVASRGYGHVGAGLANPPTVPASQVLDEAKRIHAWLTDRTTGE